MRKWNQESAPNNNLPAAEIKSSELIGNGEELQFSEELSGGGERNEIIERAEKE
ncbi:hypothetical protein KZX50_05500 [Bacillus infantis]|uniref:hypothetical protein n=1 Tax=Bacillus infantis TaxID=324767 RepID=UPI001483C734|nr:hypothetical protein [Bacillus infantis]MCK6204919.1 hypothetical protein [Bacillus infantis]